MRRLIIGFAFLGALSPARAVDAQATNYQVLIVGDRSAGLGTAFTGLANDASAIYYNPAGLLQQEASTVTGGFYLQAFETMVIEDGLRTDFGQWDLYDNSRPTYPTFVATTISLGRRDEEGRRPYVLGMTSFRYNNTSRSVYEAIENPDTGLTDTFEVTGRNRVTYYGVSFSQRLQNRWSWGVSLFLSEQRLRQEQNVVQVRGADPFDMSTSVFELVNFSLSAKSYYAVPRLGLLHRINDRVQVGAMLQLPGIRIKSRTNFTRQAAYYDLSVDPADALYVYAEDKNVDTRLPIPPEVRLGFAYRPAERHLITGDLSFVTPIPAREVFNVDDLPDVPVGSIYYPQSTKRNAVVNVSVGYQWNVARIFMLQFGAYTNFSSAPTIDQDTNAFAPSEINTFGIGMSATLHNNHRGLAVGVVTEFGRGTALGYDLDPDLAGGESLYYPADARLKVIYLSISGATQVVEDVSMLAVSHYSPEATSSSASERDTLFNIRSTEQREMVAALLRDPSTRTALGQVQSRAEAAGRRAFEVTQSPPEPEPASESADAPETETEPTPEPVPEPEPVEEPLP